MKTVLKLISVVSLIGAFAATPSFAQSVGVKDIPADADTTIRIEKGSRTDEKYEVITNSDDIEGDSANLKKDARDNWNTACKEWKKETKELYKADQIVALSCGKRICSTNEMEITCHSEAVSKVKVRVK